MGYCNEGLPTPTDMQILSHYNGGPTDLGRGKTIDEDEDKQHGWIPSGETWRPWEYLR